MRSDRFIEIAVSWAVRQAHFLEMATEKKGGRPGRGSGEDRRRAGHEEL
jgi:hypothetical protein